MGSQSGMGAVATIIAIDCIPYHKLAFDMVFGISISGDSKISNIARALEEACDLRHTVKHLYNRLNTTDYSEKLEKATLAEYHHDFTEETTIFLCFGG